jgi:hypothetical protein
VTISKTALWLSVLAAILVLIASVAGLLLKSTYARETTSYALQGVAQDIVNSVAAVTMLMTAYLAGRGSVRAFLVWLGVVLTVVYSYVIYAFAVHFNGLFPVYVAILGLSFYALVLSVCGLPPDRLHPSVVTAPIAKVVSVFLLVVALLFYLQWLSEDVPALLSGTVPRSVLESGLLTNPVHVLDMAFMLPAMIVTAILLWNRRPIGALLAVPLLVFSLLTVMGILAIFAVTSLNGTPPSVVVELLFGALALVSLLLTVLYLRDEGVSQPGK